MLCLASVSQYPACFSSRFFSKGRSTDLIEGTTILAHLITKISRSEPLGREIDCVCSLSLLFISFVKEEDSWFCNATRFWFFIPLFNTSWWLIWLFSARFPPSCSIFYYIFLAWSHHRTVFLQSLNSLLSQVLRIRFRRFCHRENLPAELAFKKRKMQI